MKLIFRALSLITLWLTLMAFAPSSVWAQRVVGKSGAGEEVDAEAARAAEHIQPDKVLLYKTVGITGEPTLKSSSTP